MNKEKIFEILKENLIELFEIDDKNITLEASIYEDLDIDSIDAIDLIDSIKKKTGYRLEPNDFRAVRTLGDIVEAVAAKID
ncbi:acyl carrier protein [Campylobacter ureolyticus]|uniref:Acyl carrier protein n=1 Tax=Campylobacter ureolyticus TaxID=827 RepID=A0A6N2TEW5_9BACT